MELDHRRLRATLALAAALATASGGAALAVPVLTFGQIGDVDHITATNPTPTQTTIAGINVPISISQYLGDSAVPFNAFLDVNLHSVSPAVATSPLPPDVIATQAFSGTISFTSLSGGLGTNYLTAVYTDTVFGIEGGPTLALLANDPPGSVSFTSAVLPSYDLQNPTGVSLAFADVTPPVAIKNGTLAAFTSTISGTISGTAVPVREPASMTMLAAGLVVTGAAFARRRSRG